MRTMPESDDHGLVCDALNANSVSGDSKHPVDAVAFSDDLSKRVKVEPGLQAICVMSPGGASIPCIETPGIWNKHDLIKELNEASNGISPIALIWKEDFQNYEDS